MSMLQALQAFISTSNWAEARQVVESHPELLQEEADRLLGQLITLADDRDDNVLAEALKLHCQLLRRCRNEGIAHVFSDVTSASRAQAPPRLKELLRELTRPENTRDVTQRLKVCQEALNLVHRNDDTRLWAMLVVEMGNCYMRWPRGDRATNLERAIKLYKAVRDFISPGDDVSTWSCSQLNLAAAYAELPRGDRAANLERAIAAYREALDVISPVHDLPTWSEAWLNLATAYVELPGGDRASNLEYAIAACQAALNVVTPEHDSLTWARAMLKLADLYRRRQKGDWFVNIEQAIAAYQMALEVLPADPESDTRAIAMVGLADSYCDRVQGDRTENLERAIELYEEAIHTVKRQTAPTDWAHIIHNLANAYCNRLQGDRAENLEYALALYKQALEVFTPDAFPEQWSAVMMNMGNAYHFRDRGDRVDNIERAIKIFLKILQVRSSAVSPDRATTLLNLGTAYCSRIHGNSDENLEKAIRAYKHALEGFRDAGLASDCRRTARSLGNLYFRQGCWAEAVEAYQQAIHASTDLMRTMLVRGNHAGELSELIDLFRHTAYAQARTGDLQGAVVSLERNLARGTTAILGGDESTLERLRASHPEEFDQYQKAAEKLRRLETAERTSSLVSQVNDVRMAPEALRKHSRSAYTAFRAVVDRIRQIPGYEHFLDEPDFNVIAQAVQPGTPLVYLVVTTAGGLALLVHATGDSPKIEAIWAHDFTSADLEALLITRTGGEVVGGYLPSQLLAPQSLDLILDKVLSELGTRLISPLARCLNRLNYGGAVLIPSGNLGLLPLHAAKCTIDRNTTHLIDAFDISFSTSASVLIAARRTLDARRSNIPVLEMVANPLPSDTPLAFAQAELEAVAHFFEPDCCWLLLGEHATKNAFLDVLPNASYVHLACHSLFDPLEPPNSYIQLANREDLTLREVLASKRFERARLVTLSACQTASATLLKRPDSMVGPAVSFLQAGAPGVITTLWPINDISTVLLMFRFYQYHLEGKAPAHALRLAQCWLRDATAEDLAKVTQDFGSGRRSKGATPTRGTFSNLALAQLRISVEEPDKRPFANPYYWSSFYFLGV